MKIPSRMSSFACSFAWRSIMLKKMENSEGASKPLILMSNIPCKSCYNLFILQPEKVSHSNCNFHM